MKDDLTAIYRRVVYTRDHAAKKADVFDIVYVNGMMCARCIAENTQNKVDIPINAACHAKLKHAMNETDKRPFCRINIEYIPIGGKFAYRPFSAEHIFDEAQQPEERRTLDIKQQGDLNTKIGREKKKILIAAAIAIICVIGVPVMSLFALIYCVFIYMTNRKFCEINDKTIYYFADNAAPADADLLAPTNLGIAYSELTENEKYILNLYSQYNKETTTEQPDVEKEKEQEDVSQSNASGKKKKKRPQEPQNSRQKTPNEKVDKHTLNNQNPSKNDKNRVNVIAQREDEEKDKLTQENTIKKRDDNDDDDGRTIVGEDGNVIIIDENGTVLEDEQGRGDFDDELSGNMDDNEVFSPDDADYSDVEF